MSENSDRPKLFLLDGHALVYRAHFAFISRPLINSKGQNTSSISGFLNSLWNILANDKPTHLAVAFDPSGGTFRHEYYPEYKAQREAQPEDITFAIPQIQRILKAMNIPIIIRDGYEADDVIGTIAKKAEQEGFNVFMVTPDKDYGQLVSDHIYMYKPSRMGDGVEILGVPEILNLWDIQRVDQVIDMLGLMGDKVDNIPGIPGVGEKTAQKLLQEYGSLESVLENADKLKGKMAEKVGHNKENATLSKYLATIKIDVPIEFNSSEYTLDPMDKDVLADIFQELEFRSLAKKILGSELSPDDTARKLPQTVQGDLFSNPSPNAQRQEDKKEVVEANYSVAQKNIENIPHQYHLVQDEKGMDQLISLLQKSELISFDTETTGLDAHQAGLVGMAFSVQPHEAWYVPVPQNREEALKLVEKFKPFLEDPQKTIVGQNIKYDATIMKWHGINMNGRFFDTMIAHYLCEPDQRHKLDILTENYLDYKMVPIESLIGKGKNQLTMRDVQLEKVKEYAGEDADLTLQLYTPFKKMLEDNELMQLYYNIEEPLIKVLRDMEYEGVKVNAKFLNDYSHELEKIIENTEKHIYQLAGTSFNISSPKQVGSVLFDKLKIPYRWKKTSTAQYSTDVEKLTELAGEHEIVNVILEYRKYTKLKSTYVDALPLLINEATGRIHSNFNQARAATGRLSSENPNLQNIPIRDEAGREIRKAFVPRNEDYILLAADYSQIELRLIAEMSKDQVMLDAFNSGGDFHKTTASKVYGVPLEEVTGEQRRNAKTVNFSIIYGAGATNLSRQLSISRSEATELISNYFKQFSGLKKYMDETVKFAREHGYVTTLLGRKRSLRDINSRNSLTAGNAERMAINTPVQGTAADMIKMAMISIQSAFKEVNLESKMIMQVHDELVFDVLKSELDRVKDIVEDKMKNAITGLNVPIVVEMGIGQNWLEAH
jgi:DNA polymerase I